MALSQQPPRPMTNQRVSRLQDTSIGRKVNFGLWIADVAALSVHVFLRRKIGFRIVEPVTIIVLAVLMFFGPNVILIPLDWFLPPPFHLLYETTSVLPLFGLLVLIAGLFHRLRHWRQIKRAETTWMTTSRGVSHFEFLPIPQHLVYRFVDAGVCFFCGWLIKHYLDEAVWGYWVMFASVCFLIVEHQSYSTQLNHSLDMLDSMIAARAQSRLVQFYSQDRNEIRLSRTETAGLPTGIGRDVERLIAQRYAIAAAAGNLAPSAAVMSPGELSAQAAERAERTIIIDAAATHVAPSQQVAPDAPPPANPAPLGPVIPAPGQ